MPERSASTNAKALGESESTSKKMQQILSRLYMPLETSPNDFFEHLTDIRSCGFFSGVNLDCKVSKLVRGLLNGESLSESISIILGVSAEELIVLSDGKIETQHLFLDKFLNLDLSKIKMLSDYPKLQKAQNRLLIKAIENSWISANDLDYFWMSVCSAVFDQEEVMLNLCRINGRLLELASPRLMNDISFIEKISEFCDLSCLRMIPAPFLENKVIATNLLKRDGRLFYLMPDSLKNDEDLALIALKKSIMCHIHVPSSLLHKKEFILKVIKEIGQDVLHFIDPALLRDEDIAYMLVKKDGFAFRHLSKDFSNNRRMALEAVRADPLALVYVGLDLYLREKAILSTNFSGQNLFKEALKFHGMAFQHLDGELSLNIGLACIAVESCPDVWKIFDPILKENFVVASIVLRKKGLLFLDFPQSLKDKEELAVIAVRQDPQIINLFPTQIKFSIPVIAAAVESDWSILSYIFGDEPAVGQILREVYLIHPHKVIEYLNHVEMPEREMEFLRSSAVEHVKNNLKEKILRFRNSSQKDDLIQILHQFYEKKWLEELAGISHNRSYMDLVILIFCSLSGGLDPISFYRQEGEIFDNFIKPKNSQVARFRKGYFKDIRNQTIQSLVDFLLVVSKLEMTREGKLKIINQILSIEHLSGVFLEMKYFVALVKSKARFDVKLEDSNFEERRQFLVKDLIASGLLEARNTQEFLKNFIKIRDPSSIFRYANLFYHDPIMKPSLYGFIQQVCSGQFETLRMLRNNPHTKRISDSVWMDWHKSFKKKIDSQGSELEIVDTDSWEDMLLSGTEVSGSCLKVDGSSDYNCCLMAHLLDSKIRMIAIKDATGKIKSRAMIKILLKNDNSPVVFLERSYPDDQTNHLIKEFAKEKARRCSLELYSMGDRTELTSFASNAPYEYEDGLFYSQIGITNGSYKVFADRIN